MIWSNLKLRQRLMLVFSGFCLLTMLLFSLYALAFAYTVEDEFFEAMLKQELSRQQAHFARTGQWADISDSTLMIALSDHAFPADLQTQFTAHRHRREFAGQDGRHYHIAPLSTDPKGAWLIAQVQDKLVFRQMRSSVVEILLGSMLFVLAMALLLAWWLARTTAMPLTELSDALARLQPGQLPDRLPSVLRQDEVGVLARGLKDLVERIQHFIEREQTFTRDASHELRTPLTVVRCALEQINTIPGLPDPAKAQLRLIQSATQNLQQTVVALLGIAREQNQPVGAIRLLPIIEQVIVEQSSWLDENSVQLRLTVNDHARITAPESVVHIVLSNLLGNAFQHGTPNGLVEVYIASGRLWIANQQLDPANAAVATAGYGFGLSIVQRLAGRFALDIRIERRPTTTLASMALDTDASL